MGATTRLDLKQGLKVKMLVPNSDQCFLLNCCSLIIFWRAVNFRSFPAANPYPCALAGLFGLGAAILMGIGSHRIYTTDVGPDLKPFSAFTDFHLFHGACSWSFPAPFPWYPLLQPGLQLFLLISQDLHCLLYSHPVVFTQSFLRQVSTDSNSCLNWVRALGYVPRAKPVPRAAGSRGAGPADTSVQRQGSWGGILETVIGMSHISKIYMCVHLSSVVL